MVNSQVNYCCSCFINGISLA